MNNENEIGTIITVQDDKNQDIEISLLEKTPTIQNIINSILNKVCDPYRLLLNITESTQDNLIIRCNSMINHGFSKCNCPFMIIDYDWETDQFELWKELAFTKIFMMSGKPTRFFKHSIFNVIKEYEDQRENGETQRNSIHLELSRKGYTMSDLEKYCGGKYSELLQNQEFLEKFEKYIQQLLDQELNKISYQELMKLWGIKTFDTNRFTSSNNINNLVPKYYNHSKGRLLMFVFLEVGTTYGHPILIFKYFQVIKTKANSDIVTVDFKNQLLNNNWSRYSENLSMLCEKTINQIIVDVAINFLNRHAITETTMLSIFNFIPSKKIKFAVNWIWNDLILNCNKESISAILIEYSNVSNVSEVNFRNLDVPVDIFSFNDSASDIFFHVDSNDPEVEFNNDLCLQNCKFDV